MWTEPFANLQLEAHSAPEIAGTAPNQLSCTPGGQARLGTRGALVRLPGGGLPHCVRLPRLCSRHRLSSHVRPSALSEDDRKPAVETCEF